MVDSEITIGVLSRRIPIALDSESVPVVEHIGGLTRVLPALAEFANINWSAVTASNQDDFPNQISYADLSGQNFSHEINIWATKVSGEDLSQGDWFGTHYVWPLLHDLPLPEIQIAELNDCLASINRLSREMATKCINDRNDGYLVNDYQLSQVPMALRELEPDKSIVFFLHTPWPKKATEDVLVIEILKFLATGMLAADVIEFQTLSDLQAFEEFLLENLSNITTDAKLSVNPVSVNVDSLLEQAFTFTNPKKLADDEISYVHISRSDPIKNTLATIKAFAAFLKDSSTRSPRTFLDLFIVPSRQQWPEYQDLLQEITLCVDECNSKLASLNYAPIRLHLDSDYQQVIQAFIRYDYLIACSVSDGLNLVVKEGAVLNQRNGVIISSKNVGAMAELGNNCVVANGADGAGIVAALNLAANLDAKARQVMSGQLKAQITLFDASHWAQSLIANFRILEKV